jgi:hypothetical protein
MKRADCASIPNVSGPWSDTNVDVAHLARIDVVLAHEIEDAIDAGTHVRAAGIGFVGERVGEPDLAERFERSDERLRRERLEKAAIALEDVVGAAQAVGGQLAGLDADGCRHGGGE